MPKSGPFQKLTYVERIAYKLISNRFVGPLQRFDYYSSLSIFAEKMALAATYSLLGEQHPHNVETFLFLRNCNIRPSQCVDLGCSSGDKTRLLARLYPNAQCFGIDIDPVKIRQASALNSYPDRVSFICSDQAVSYPALGVKKEGSFLFLSHVLEHMSSPGDFLSLIASQFSYVYIEVPDFENTHLGGLRVKLGLNMLLRDPDHCFEWRRDELIDICTGSGLRILNLEFRSGVVKVLAIPTS